MNGAIMLAMTNSIEIPNWLSSPTPSTQPMTTADRREMTEKQFEIAFPRMMDLIAEGYHLSEALKEYHVEIKNGPFLNWIYKDPGREAAYKHAKKIRSEFWVGQLLRRASGDDGLNDVARDKLFTDKLQWVIENDNRREYGKHTVVETHQSINLNAVLEMANARLPVINRVIDHDEDLEDE